MFSSIWNFVKRHRRKFYVVGGVFATLSVANRYLTYKLEQWEKVQALEYLERVKREHHFEGTIETCDSTIISILPKLSEILKNEIDTEILLEELKQNPPNKIEIWQDLKIKIFSLAVSDIYCQCLLVTFARVQLNVIGGYIFVDSQNQMKFQNAEVPTLPIPQAMASSVVQRMYLSFVQHYLDVGVPEITKVITNVVQLIMGNFSLKESITLNSLHKIFNSIKQGVNVSECAISNVSQYLMPPSISEICEKSGASPRDAEVLKSLHGETMDILENADCRRVLYYALDEGFGMIMDSLSECYLDMNRENNNFTNLHSVAVPLAKLLPVLNRVVREPKCNGEFSFALRLLKKDMLKSFSANVYEAFSHSSSQPDDLLRT